MTGGLEDKVPICLLSRDWLLACVTFAQIDGSLILDAEFVPGQQQQQQQGASEGPIVKSAFAVLLHDAEEEEEEDEEEQR